MINIIVRFGFLLRKSNLTKKFNYSLQDLSYSHNLLNQQGALRKIFALLGFCISSYQNKKIILPIEHGGKYISKSFI